LLDTDLKIILLDQRNNFVGTLKIMSNAAKNFDIPATSFLHNFDISTKLLFLSKSSYPAKIVDPSAKAFVLRVSKCYYGSYYSTQYVEIRATTRKFKML